VLIGSFGLDVAATRWISKNNSTFQSVQSLVVKFIIGFPLIIIIFYFLIAPVLGFHFLLPLTTILLFGLGNLLMILYQGIMMGLKKFNALNFMFITTNILFVVYLFLLTIFKLSGLIFWVGVGYGFLLIIQGVTCVLISRRSRETKVDPINKKEFIYYSFTILLSSVVYYCFLKVDNFFVAKYYNNVSLSNYIQCGKIGQYFIYFSSAVNVVIIPYLSSDSTMSLKKWMQILKPYIFLLILGALVLLFFGNYFYVSFFGKSFSMMHSLMVAFLPGFFCLGLLTLINAVFIARGQILRMLLGDIIGLILLILLDLFLLPHFGVQTAALFSSICYAVVLVFLLTGIKKQFILRD
jgi:O-antigen/teichoic acid export membrane protein